MEATGRTKGFVPKFPVSQDSGTVRSLRQQWPIVQESVLDSNRSRLCEEVVR